MRVWTTIIIIIIIIIVVVDDTASVGRAPWTISVRTGDSRMAIPTDHSSHSEQIR
jgi:hypothetical protein